MKYTLLLLFSLTFLSCDHEEEENARLMSLEKELTEIKSQLAAANNQSQYTPGLIHSVFFWLKEDLSKPDAAAFLEGAKSLKGIESVKGCYIGPPAPTEARDVVDNTYTYALIVHFDDVEGQNAYQVDPVHLKFVEDHKDKWTKVVVYDNTMLAK